MAVEMERMARGSDDNEVVRRSAGSFKAKETKSHEREKWFEAGLPGASLALCNEILLEMGNYEHYVLAQAEPPGSYPLRRGYFSDESRRRRGCDIPWRRVAATPRVPRG